MTPKKKLLTIKEKGLIYLIPQRLKKKGGLNRPPFLGVTLCNTNQLFIHQHASYAETVATR